MERPQQIISPSISSWSLHLYKMEVASIAGPTQAVMDSLLWTVGKDIVHALENIFVPLVIRAELIQSLEKKINTDITCIQIMMENRSYC